MSYAHRLRQALAAYAARQSGVAQPDDTEWGWCCSIPESPSGQAKHRSSKWHIAFIYGVDRHDLRHGRGRSDLLSLIPGTTPPRARVRRLKRRTYHAG